MKPLDALDRVLAWVGPRDRYHGRYVPHTKPGEVIERQPADVREALSRLTSDDAANVRDDEMRYYVEKS